MNTHCAHCGKKLPGPYGTPGVSMARTQNVLLCSDCGRNEAMRNIVECLDEAMKEVGPMSNDIHLNGNPFCKCKTCLPEGESARTFDQVMKEVQALRGARANALWKLFRLSVCQSAIREARK
jgi:hypothetical protein